MKTTLEKLHVDHPYYCNMGNYYSNEPYMEFETMSEFLDEFEDADIDMNLIFRWDIKERGENAAKHDRYCAEVFIMHQRKGNFRPIDIRHVNESEAVRFNALLEKHWEKIKELWNPINK